MEKEPGSAYKREELKSTIQDLERQITLLESTDPSNTELSQLRQQYNERVNELQTLDSSHDDLAAAA